MHAPCACSLSLPQGRQAKRDTLAEIVEAERQIMLWERKVQLEKEMKEVLDPTVGQVRACVRVAACVRACAVGCKLRSAQCVSCRGGEKHMRVHAWQGWVGRS